jgi:hypothetical protein
MITHHGNRTVTGITVSHSRGAVQLCHRNCVVEIQTADAVRLYGGKAIW